MGNKANPESDFEKAKNYAFLLLKFRQRSNKEIYERLKKKNFDDEIIKKTLSFLEDKKFLNDEEFARAWIEERLKKPLGLRKIREELKLKGINKEIIDNQLAELKKRYSEENIVLEIAEEKYRKLKGIEPQKAKQRILGYLLRRGFSADIVFDLVKREKIREEERGEG